MSNVELGAIERAITYYLGPESPSVLECCRRFGVAESTLRRVLKSRGIIRSSAAAQKRERVEHHFAGGDVADKMEDCLPTVDAIIEAAREDVADMEDGLKVARECLKRLLKLAPLAADAAEVKRVAEANKIAIETIRRIRELDAVPDFASMSDEELEAIARGGRR